MTRATRKQLGMQTRIEAAVLRFLLSRSEATVRRLAGPPVERDGLSLEAETQLVLRLQRATRSPVVERVPVPTGRVVLQRQAAAVAGDLPVGSVRDVDLDGLPGRLYVPSGAPSRGPLMLFLHGGGFVWGGIDTHDAPCRLLAERSGVRILSVDYRLAPEHPFPAAYDDAVAAFRWLLEHTDDVDADPERLAVGGDSAGGNLAVGVAAEAARQGWPLRWQLLVYPAVDQTRATRSAELFAEGFYLTRDFMEIATAHYTPPPTDLTDPRLSPLLHPVPSGMAPAHLVTAGFDPLRDEGEAFAAHLTAAGVAVDAVREAGQIHGFFNTVGVGRSARQAVERMADRMRDALVG